MTWCLSHKTAVQYWRSPLAKPASKRVRGIVVPSTPPCAAELRLPANLQFSLPLNIVVAEEGGRSGHKEVVSHIFAGTLPEGCFVDAGKGLYVSAPEFCFLQMASELPLVKLIRLGFELCGSYRIHGSPKDVLLEFDPSKPIDIGHESLTNSKPLTNVKKIAAFLNKMDGRKGIKQARRALQYVLDGSASPMETALAMILTLPHALGGFSLSAPSMNQQIEIAPGNLKMAGKTSFYCDLFWEEGKLAVEYDSDAHHTKSEQIAQDAKRRNALIALGVTVLTVTRKQIMSADEITVIARQIAKHLDRHLRLNRAKDFAGRYRELRRALFG